jgi:hypothetical protein
MGPRYEHWNIAASDMRMKYLNFELVSRNVYNNINVKITYFQTIIRVFENRVLRRIFGPKRDEVTGGFITCTLLLYVNS